ncbi:MAG: tetratricopeptide repeat protein [Chitinophagia bacterium]|nr:tetratricopeptide repeat protein [Chitinophagia bacterium]
MAQKKKSIKNAGQPNTPAAVPVSPATVPEAPAVVPMPATGLLGSLSTLRVQQIILMLLVLVFYGNTFMHETALDDGVVIVHNQYVQQGFAGIGKILGGDAYESFTEQQNTGNQLEGGRYRPLSIITFAIEQQLLGIDNSQLIDTSAAARKALIAAKTAKMVSDMHVRHIINVLLYGLCILVLLHWLRKTVFTQKPFMAFTAALLFAVHPLHTEVVANVKSRDEILSLLFIGLTLSTFFRYAGTKKITDLALALLCYFMALLSKEYAVVLVLLLPISLYFFNKTDLKTAFIQSIPLVLPLIVYVVLRKAAIADTAENSLTDIMNHPYLYATVAEEWATKLYVLWRYFALLWLPYPLCSDYGYNALPYTQFSNPFVIISLLLHGGLVYLLIKGFKGRQTYAYGIVFYFAFLALIANIFVNIGAPMGERLLFHSSLGFAIAVSYGSNTMIEKLTFKSKWWVFTGIMEVLVVLCAIITISRNNDWKNSNTLFLKDVKTAPESVMINTNAGGAWIDASERATDTLQRNGHLKTAISHFTKAISINDKYMNAYINRAICYLRLNDYAHALSDIDSVNKYYPAHPFLERLQGRVSLYYTNKGLDWNAMGNTIEAMIAFKKSAEAQPRNPDNWYNLAMAYYKLNQSVNAQTALAQALRLNPQHKASLQMQQIINTTPPAPQGK